MAWFYLVFINTGGSEIPSHLMWKLPPCDAVFPDFGRTTAVLKSKQGLFIKTCSWLNRFFFKKIKAYYIVETNGDRGLLTNTNSYLNVKLTLRRRFGLVGRLEFTSKIMYLLFESFKKHNIQRFSTIMFLFIGRMKDTFWYHFWLSFFLLFTIFIFISLAITFF